MCKATDYIFPTYNTFTLHMDRNIRGVMAQMKDLEEHLLSYLPKKQELQMRIAVTTNNSRTNAPDCSSSSPFIRS